MAHSSNRSLRKLMFEAYYGRASPTVDRLNRNVENIVEITRKRFVYSSSEKVYLFMCLLCLEN